MALATIGGYRLVILAVGDRGWQVGTLEVDDWMAAGRNLGLLVGKQARAGHRADLTRCPLPRTAP